MNRVNAIVGQLRQSEEAKVEIQANPTAASSKNPDDVVIVAALRTAIGRARKGKFAQSDVIDMLSPVLKAVVDKAGIAPAEVGDIVVGSVLGPSGFRANECRMAAFVAGFPETVPVHTVNRQCSSGLQAVAHVAASIKAGYYDVGIGSGVELMSQGRFKWDGSLNPKAQENDKARACLVPMGITSENVASQFGVSREKQDRMSAESHRRAAAAIRTGRFRDEIVPVKVTYKDRKTGEEKTAIMDTDEGVRPGTTVEVLSRLKPVFKKGGSTTAGNASQVSDGAAAVLLMKRSRADRLGLPILGVFRSFSVAGVDPNIMGIGPAVAIPQAVAQADLKINDIDLFEINEAFASQATYCVEKLGLDWGKVNVNGGAVAIGHPLGMTGARMTATLLHEMHKRGSRYGIVSMCIGSGMGAAAVFEVEY